MADSCVRLRAHGVLLVLAVLAGCAGPHEPLTSRHGSTGITSSYISGRLRAELPAGVDLPAAVCAVERSLESRGYDIRRAEVIETRGVVVSKPPGGGFVDEVVVRLHDEPQATSVQIDVRPFGDPLRSQSILESMVDKLGL